MPKSIKVARVDVGSMDNEAVEPKNFTGIEKTLKILKFVCIGIAISAVAGTATFAGIIYNQTKRIENMERAFDIVQSDIAAWQNQANKDNLAPRDAHNQAYANISNSEFEQVKDQVDTLVTIVDTHGDALTQQEAYTNYLENRIEDYANQTVVVESKMKKEVETLKHQVTSQNDILTALNASIMRRNASTNELCNSSHIGDTNLSQIEANLNSLGASVQDLISYNVERESNDTMYQEQMESRLFQIELDIETDRENVNNNLTALGLQLTIVYTSVESYHEELIELGDTIGLLNESLAAKILDSENARNFGSDVTDLEQKMDTVEYVIQNNSYTIRLLNETVAATYFDMVKLGSRVTELERKVKAIESAFQNNSIELNTALLDMEELNKSTSDSISKIDTKLTNVTANIPESYYAFSAYNLSAVTPTSAMTLVFAQTLVNDGGVYNTSTGKFTAPCDGVYQFHSTLSGGPEEQVLNVEFRADDTPIGTFAILDDYYVVGSSGSAIARLLKGTHVHIRVRVVSPSFAFAEGEGFMNTFMGHLISK